MKKIFSYIATITIAAVLFTMNSCDTCKHTSTYTSSTGGTRMTYGHDGDGGINLNKSKTPYAPVKAKRQKSAPSRYARHWWDS